MRSIIIRCDGSSALGMGHLVRCLALARELRAMEVEPVFAVCDGVKTLAMIAAAGFTGAPLPRDYGAETLLGLAKKHAARLFFLDQRDAFSADAVRALRQAECRVVIYDDLSERRLAADVCIYPPIEQIHSLSWDGFSGTTLSGWEWIILRREFAEVSGRTDYRDPPRILITMGGADPAGFTADALDAVQSMEGARVTVVVGPMMARAGEIAERAKASRAQLSIVSSPPALAFLMLEHDLALASFGVTAYELAACGVPMLLWGLTDDHLVSAGTLANAGIATVAAHPGNLSPLEVRRMIEPWLYDPARRADAGKAGQKLCDGRGAARIAGKITELVDCKR